MKVFIILGFVAIASSAVRSMTIHDISGEWNVFKTKFNKAYKNVEEELFRKKLYLENKIKIEEHNKLYKSGQVTYTLKMNQFGDMANQEFSAKTKGFNQSLKNNFDDGKSVTFLRPENAVIPSSIDWRNKGAVTPVKNQGNKCGSCWAFSSTGALEGQHFRKTGKLVSLSEQNLVDCSRWFGNNGCRGGLMDQAFKYIKYNRGIDTEESYPYQAVDGKCRYRIRNKGATDRGFVDIATGDEKALTEAVATVGPISVAIDASSDNFRFYDKGVYNDPTCSSKNLDHGILAVGYDTTEAGEEYWIVKNSWGKDWGQGGYVWMPRNKNNTCGIATAASYPLV